MGCRLFLVDAVHESWTITLLAAVAGGHRRGPPCRDRRVGIVGCRLFPVDAVHNKLLAAFVG